VAERLPTPDGWLPDRPAEIRNQGAQPTGPQLGAVGPDQGYALKLARLLEPRLVVDSMDDTIAGAVPVGMRRAALYGRAPVIHDLELAFTLFGFMPGAPSDLIDYRRPLFQGVAHSYNQQRAIVDLVPEATLRLTPADVTGRVQSGGWRALLGLAS
jgi:hypothetical protein